MLGVQPSSVSAAMPRIFGEQSVREDRCDVIDSERWCGSVNGMLVVIDM